LELRARLGSASTWSFVHSFVMIDWWPLDVGGGGNEHFSSSPS